jgi:serine/threonine-protein kinase
MINYGDLIDNRYNVLSLLGLGGMAVVFECNDVYKNKIVAVKIMKEELLNEAGMLDAFKKEVKATVQMSHPNIMEIYSEGVFQTRPYLVLEYLKGQTLLDKIEYYTKFSVKEACEIMVQLLDAISYTHEHKIIHRDIKPQNIFYLSNGTVKLGDFGIAKNEKEAENHGKILGSVHFLAPEVLQGKPFSVASDIYAAGITLFQLVTGNLPYDGSTKEVAEQQVKKEFPKASNYVTSIPKEFDEIILKAVEKNPKNRYKNAEEFKRAIQLFLLGKKEKKSLFSRFF